MSRTLIHKEVQNLDTDLTRVWSIVSDFSGVAMWAPTVSQCSVQGDGIGAVRTVTESGISFQEKLETLDTESHTIGYKILDPTPFPMTGFHGAIHLMPDTDATTCLTWTAEAESIDEQGLNLVAPVMEKFIKTSISGLRKALDIKSQE